jgi:hypothetical protein
VTIYNTYVFVGIAIYGYFNHKMDIAIEFTSFPNIYNINMCASIAIYGHSNHKMDITIEFPSKLLQNMYNIYVFASIVVLCFNTTQAFISTVTTDIGDAPTNCEDNH